MRLLEVAEHDRVIYLRVPEPVPLGPASEQLAREFVDACAEIEMQLTPPASVAVLSDGTSFCVLPPASADDCDAAGQAWGQATSALGRVGAPTLAAINGDAIGSAWELALACDLRIAAYETRVGNPEVRWGRIPAAGGTQRLTRLVGQATALRLLLLGEVLSASAALELALVHRVEPAARLVSSLEQLLGALRGAAPTALAYAKETVRRAVELPLEDGLRLEADLTALLQTTHDRAEGIRAFLERRDPHFEAR